MKKLINVLFLSLLTITVFANPSDSLKLEGFFEDGKGNVFSFEEDKAKILYSYDVNTLAPAPQGNWLYASLIESPTYISVCKKTFAEKCYDVILNISATTTDPAKKARRKYATDVLSNKTDAVIRAVQRVTTNSIFTNIDDPQVCYDLIQAAFNDNFDVLAGAN